MKRIFFSNGIFKTELIVWPPEGICEREDVCFARVRQPRFEVRKTSRCLMRYETEAGDEAYINELHSQVLDAMKKLTKELITRHECKVLADKYYECLDIYRKAETNYEEVCKNMYYIETADETDRGCQAMYRISNDMIQKDDPCKIGEPLVVKIW